MPRKILSRFYPADSLVEGTEIDKLAKEKTIEKLECELMQEVGEIHPDENPDNDKAAKNMESNRSEMADFEIDVEEKENRARMARLHSAALLEKLKIVSKAAIRMEKRAKEWEQALKEEEQRNKDVESQHCQHQEALSAKTQELQCLKSRENILLANISTGQATVTVLQKRQSENKQVLIKKKELIHDQEFQIAALEKKLEGLSEEDEKMKERKSLQEEESELARTLQEKKETARKLKKEQKNTETELRSGRRAVEKTAGVQRDLSCKMKEMELDTDAAVRELKRMRVKKQDTLRRETLLRQEVKRVSGCAQTEADWLIAMETRKLQLELAVKELEVENSFKRETHQAKTVISSQGSKKLRAEVNQKLHRAEILRRRYETVGASSLRFQVEDITLQSQPDRTRENKELQARLDLWTQKVFKKQEEVKTLENTLCTHSSRNPATSQMHRATPRSGTLSGQTTRATSRSAKDHVEQKLEEEKKALEETCCSKKKRILKLQQEVKRQKIALDKLLREETLQKRWLDQAQSRVQSLKKQLKSQEAKLEQAHQQCSELTLEVQSALKTQARDEEINFSREVNLMLLAVMDKQTDLASVLQTQFQQSNLSLPTPASRQGQEPACISARSSGRDSKLAVTRALLCPAPHTNGNANSSPTPRCPPNSPEDEQSPHPSKQDKH